jgi:hypothetical protein
MNCKPYSVNINRLTRKEKNGGNGNNSDDQENNLLWMIVADIFIFYRHVIKYLFNGEDDT